MQAAAGCRARGAVSPAGRSGQAWPVAPAPIRAAAGRAQAALHVRAQAKQKGSTGNVALDNALQVGQGLVESAANLVPDSVPRPVAKGGVAVAGVLVAFWALQKLVSTVLTIALLGGAAWFYLQSSGRDGGGGGGGGGGGARDDAGDLDDPLAEARRIMGKYK